MNKANIALVSFESLGDSLIYMMMADNLRRNGFDITLFGNVPYQLRKWIPELAVQPYPEAKDFFVTLDEFHLVLLSPSRSIRDAVDEIKLEHIRNRFVLICQKAPKSWLSDHHSRLKQNLDGELFKQIENLCQAVGSIRYRKFDKESVVDITLDYMREKMGLKTLSRNIDLSPPKGLVFRKNRRRIIISPDSAWPEKKDWSPERFLKLCDLLAKANYEPIIVVGPNNHQVWQTKSNNRFPTLTFETIDKLAEFIYESGAMIANDSGNGHLASFLGLPVVTIYRKRNPYFHWRPDWSETKVVCPKIVLPGPKGPIWRPFIGVGRVKRALEKLLRQVEST
jgi:hypothetical protein